MEDHLNRIWYLLMLLGLLAAAWAGYRDGRTS